MGVRGYQRRPRPLRHRRRQPDGMADLRIPATSQRHRPLSTRPAVPAARSPSIRGTRRRLIRCRSRAGGYLRGRAKTRVARRRILPRPGRLLGRQMSGLPTDHVATAEVSQLCPQCSTLSAAFECERLDRRSRFQSCMSRNFWATTRVSSPTVNMGSPRALHISAECRNCS
jgi:hypothetical protein